MAMKKDDKQFIGYFLYAMGLVSWIAAVTTSQPQSQIGLAILGILFIIEASYLIAKSK